MVWTCIAEDRKEATYKVVDCMQSLICTYSLESKSFRFLKESK